MKNLVLVLVLAIVSGSTPVYTAEQSDTPREAAKLYQEGLRHLEKCDYDEACVALEIAFRWDPTKPEYFTAMARAKRASEEQFHSCKEERDGPVDWIVKHRYQLQSQATNWRNVRDGGWSFQGDFANPGADKSRTKATALSLLALLGAGNTLERGKYFDEAREGLYFLGSEMVVGEKGGDLRGKHGDMVSHAMAALVFSELCCMAQEPDVYGMGNATSLKAPAQAAIRFIELAQHSPHGGWGVQPGQPGDMAVTGWQIMALVSAKRAGLNVSEETIRRANAFLDRVESDGGAFYGRSEPGKEPTATAIGLCCRMLLSWQRDNPALQRGVQYLVERGPSKHDALYNFFGTQVAHHSEGVPWRRWNSTFRKQIAAPMYQAYRAEEEAGSYFHADDPVAVRGGRLHQTALNLLALQVYYRRSPIFTKNYTLLGQRRY